MREEREYGSIVRNTAVLDHDALDGGTEADYWQEKLDRLLLDLLRDHQALIPFGERYPEIREITYGPRRAGKG